MAEISVQDKAIIEAQKNAVDVDVDPEKRAEFLARLKPDNVIAALRDWTMAYAAKIEENDPNQNTSALIARAVATRGI